MNEIEKIGDNIDKEVAKLVYKDSTRKRIKFVYKFAIYGVTVGFIFWFYDNFQIKDFYDKFDEIIRTVEKDLVDKYNHLINNE
jgi:hypothetical protein